MIAAVATYLPTWDDGRGNRVCGPDEDAITMAVAAGLAAAAGAEEPIVGVALVSRDLPLLEGGNAAALVAGLGLADDVDVVERAGGAPAALDALTRAPARWLVIGVDDGVSGAGSGAALMSNTGGDVEAIARVHRSLPLRLRDRGGALHEDEDPRLQRERGTRAAIDAVNLDGPPAVIAGLAPKEAAVHGATGAQPLPTTGASSPLFALADLADHNASGVVAAVEQATLSVVRWVPGGATVRRLRRPAQPAQRATLGLGADIKMVFTAYERAFDSKVRWEASRCPSCATLAFPRRFRCVVCGAEEHGERVSLPRSGIVYTTATVRVPVPGMAVPYSVAVVQLDGVDVRALVPVTDATAGSVDIGDRGRVVLRRHAVRAGVPDYGYAFVPDAVGAIGGSRSEEPNTARVTT